MAVILPLDQLVERLDPRLPPRAAGDARDRVGAHGGPHAGLGCGGGSSSSLLFPTGHLDWRYGRQTLALAVAGARRSSPSARRSVPRASSGIRRYPTRWRSRRRSPRSSVLLSLVGVGAVRRRRSPSLPVCLVWRYRNGSARQRRLLAWVAVGATAMAGSVALFYVGRYAGTVAGTDGERLAFVAAAGAALLPLAMLRFATVTASQGQETRDLTFLFTDLQGLDRHVCQHRRYVRFRPRPPALRHPHGGRPAAQGRDREDHRGRPHGALPRSGRCGPGGARDVRATRHASTG